jgi:hypothetical protein
MSPHVGVEEAENDHCPPGLAHSKGNLRKHSGLTQPTQEGDQVGLQPHNATTAFPTWTLFIYTDKIPTLGPGNL